MKTGDIITWLFGIIIGIWILCNLDFIMLLICGLLLVLSLAFIVLSPMIILYAIVDSIL